MLGRVRARASTEEGKAHKGAPTGTKNTWLVPNFAMACFFWKGNSRSTIIYKLR